MPITLVGRDTPSKRLLQEAINARMAAKRWTFDARVTWGQRGHGNKLQELQALAAAGVPCVPFTTSRAEAERWAAGGWVYGRRLYHTCGRDIVVCGPRQFQRQRAWRRRWVRFRNRPFWSRYIRSTSEWRLNVAYGRVVCFGRKFRPDGQQPPDPLIRARRLGWHMTRDTRYSEALATLAKAACTALRCDFGAVDIIETPTHGPLVLEVNAAPGMDTRTAEQYAIMICRRQRRLWRERQGLPAEVETED